MKIPEFFDITVNWLEQFRVWIADNEKSASTTSIYLRNLRTIFNQYVSDIAYLRFKNDETKQEFADNMLNLLRNT